VVYPTVKIFLWCSQAVKLMKWGVIPPHKVGLEASTYGMYGMPMHTVTLLFCLLLCAGQGRRLGYHLLQIEGISFLLSPLALPVFGKSYITYHTELPYMATCTLHITSCQYANWASDLLLSSTSLFIQLICFRDIMLVCVVLECLKIVINALISQLYMTEMCSVVQVCHTIPGVSYARYWHTGIL